MMILPERRLLQFLCDKRREKRLRRQILASLRDYRFLRMEHQVLFDCLQAMPPVRQELIRELLPAWLVRAGFPDFDLDPFLQPGTVSEEEARKICRELIEPQTVPDRETGRTAPSPDTA